MSISQNKPLDSCSLLAIEMKTAQLLFLLLAVVLVPEVLASTAVNARETDTKDESKREAYVTLLYGDYLLPVRVLGLSLKLAGTKREMVVLCTDELSMKDRKILEGDGWTVKQTKSITSPYRNYGKQYRHVFTKLLIWTLTEYRRIVFMDSDTLVYANIDELFHCGKFCAAYRHSDLFNSGVLVVKPDLQEYRNLINKIGIYPSYDNADQGFFNYYHQSLIFAPMLNASNNQNQEEPMRLPAAYNADVGQYYVYTSRFFPLTNFKVLHHTLGPVKPWKWWAYPIFELNWRWVEFRENLKPSPDSYLGLFLAAAVNFFLLLILMGFKSYKIRRPDWNFELNDTCFLYQVILTLMFPTSCLLAFYAVPGSMNPHVAIPSFCLWTIFFVRLFCSFVHLFKISSQAHVEPCMSSSCSLALIGLLLFMPLVLPLWIPCFFTRVCVFLTLTLFSFVCSDAIIKRYLIHNWS